MMRMMERKIVFILMPIIFLLSLVFLDKVMAVNSLDPTDINNLVKTQIDSGAQPAYGQTPADAPSIVAGVIKILLGMTGTICFVLIVMSGYWFLTSHGDSEVVEKAQTTVRNAVLGLIIVLGAYGVTVLVSTKVRGLLNPPQRTVQEETTLNFVQTGGFCGSAMGITCDIPNLWGGASWGSRN